jgi:hypothetical protein
MTYNLTPELPRARPTGKRGPARPERIHYTEYQPEEPCTLTPFEMARTRSIPPWAYGVGSGAIFGMALLIVGHQGHIAHPDLLAAYVGGLVGGSVWLAFKFAKLG